MTGANDWLTTFRNEHQAVTLYLLAGLMQAVPERIGQPAAACLAYTLTVHGLEHYLSLVTTACPDAEVEFAAAPRRDPTSSPNLEIRVQRQGHRMNLGGKAALIDTLLEDWEVPEKGVRPVWGEVLDEMQGRILPTDRQNLALFQGHLTHAAGLVGQRLGRGEDRPLRYRARLAHIWCQGGTDAERRAREDALLTEFPDMCMRQQRYDNAAPSRAEVNRRFQDMPWRQAKGGRRG